MITDYWRLCRQTYILAGQTQLLNDVIAINRRTIYLFIEKWILPGMFENTTMILWSDVVTFVREFF